jgi:dihydroorotase-like cyclic amidohydrolase
MWAAHSGTPGIDFQLPLLLDAARNGLVNLERAIDSVTRRPADIFGLGYKGRLSVGADADIAIVDLSTRWTITDDDTFSKVGWTPYNGREVGARVVRTMVRGADVFRDGRVVGVPGHGTMASPGRKDDAWP